VQLPGGRWISEKDPGYPYLAVAFQALGLIRLALFYAALACLGLYVSGRRWLGRFGGAAAVGLCCSSGAAIAAVAALFGLGSWAFHDMYQFPFGPEIAVVPGPGGTVELRPGPGVIIGGHGSVTPAGPGRAAHIEAPGRPSVRPAS
jgi:hypothetical protein